MALPIEKSGIPIIWLDSSVIIKITKLKNGYRLNPIDTERTTRLYTLVNEKVHQRRLLCPVGYQREEYELKAALVEDCYRLQQELSLGICFNGADQIKVLQIREAVDSFLTGKDLAISYRDAFPRDPEEQLRRGGRFSPRYVKPAEISTYQSTQMNRWGLGEMERIRAENVRNGVTFEQQLRTEYTFVIQALQNVVTAWEGIINSGIPPTHEGLMHALTVAFLDI